MAAALAEYQKKTVGLARGEAVKKEIAARDAWLKVAGSEEMGRRKAGRSAEKLKAFLPTAITDYQAVVDQYAGTVYSAKAKAAVERLKTEISG